MYEFTCIVATIILSLCRNINFMNEKEISSLGIEDLKNQRTKVLQQKETYFELYSTFKKKLSEAKREAAVNKKFLPASEYRAIENRMKEYNAETQRLQKLSGEINSAIKQKEAYIIERLFVTICKERLSVDIFNSIIEECQFRILKNS